MDKCLDATLEDVCKHANELTKSEGLGTLVHLLLQGFHATRISEIPENRYDEFVIRCNWLKIHEPSPELLNLRTELNVFPSHTTQHTTQ